MQKRFGSNRIVNTARCRRWYAYHLIRETGKIIDVRPLARLLFVLFILSLYVFEHGLDFPIVSVISECLFGK